MHKELVFFKLFLTWIRSFIKNISYLYVCVCVYKIENLSWKKFQTSNLLPISKEYKVGKKKFFPRAECIRKTNMKNDWKGNDYSKLE